MPLDENRYRDKRMQTGRAGKAMRNRVLEALRSGEVAYDWPSAPWSLKKMETDRARMFEEQVPEDPVERVRYIEAEQERLQNLVGEKGPRREFGVRNARLDAMRSAWHARNPAAQADEAFEQSQKPQMAGDGGPAKPSSPREAGGEARLDKGAQGGSEGLSPEDRSMFRQGDPEFGMKGSEVGAQAAGLRIREPNPEPVIRMGDATGFYDAGMRMPYNAPKWLRETWELMDMPVEALQRQMLQLGGGMIEGLQNAGHSLDLGYLSLKKAFPGLSEMESAYYEAINSPDYDPITQSSWGVVVQRPEDFGSSITRTVGQFAPLFIAGVSAMRGLGLGGASVSGAVSRDIVAGAVTDFAVFNAMEGNLHTMMRELGLENEWTQWMDASETDSHMDGKLRNMIEGALLTAGVEGAFRFGRWMSRKGEMLGEQARHLADSIVRASRATRELRELRFRAMQEDAMRELDESARGRSGTLYSMPGVSPQEMKNLIKLAYSSIARRAMKVEDFVMEWGTKRNYGAEAAQRAWEEAEKAILEGNDPTRRIFSRLTENVMRMPPKQPIDQYINSIKNHKDIKRNEVEFSGVLEWLEERKRMGVPTVRQDIVEYLGDMPVEVHLKILGHHEGKTGPEPILYNKDPVGFRAENGAVEEVLPLDYDAMRNVFIEDRLNTVHEREVAFQETELRANIDDEAMARVVSEKGDLTRAQMMGDIYRAFFGDEDDALQVPLRDDEVATWINTEDLDATMRHSRHVIGLDRKPKREWTRQDKLALAEESYYNYRRRRAATHKKALLEQSDIPAEATRIADETVARERSKMEAMFPIERFWVKARRPKAPDDESVIVIYERGDDGGTYLLDGHQYAEFESAINNEGPLDGLGYLHRNHIDQGGNSTAIRSFYRDYASRHPEVMQDVPVGTGKFQRWTVNPSADNYEELVFRWEQDPKFETLRRRRDALNDATRDLVDSGELDESVVDAWRTGGLKPEEAPHPSLKELAELRQEAMEASPTLEKPRQPYQGTGLNVHWGVHDVWAHYRAAVHADADGRVGGHLEETQSDWMGMDYGKTNRWFDQREVNRLSDELRVRQDAIGKFRQRVRQEMNDVSRDRDVGIAIENIKIRGVDNEDTLFVEWFGSNADRPMRFNEAVERLAGNDPRVPMKHALFDALEAIAAGVSNSRLGFDEILRNAVTEYRTEMARSMEKGTMPRPPGEYFDMDEFPASMKGPQDALWPVRRLFQNVYDAADRTVSMYPDILQHEKELNRLRRLKYDVESSVYRPPGAEDNLWQEFTIRHFLHRMVNVHNVDYVDVVTGQWESFNWGNSPIAFKVEGDSLIVGFASRPRPSPHRLDDDTLDRVHDEVMKMSPGNVSGVFMDPTDDSAVRSMIQLRSREIDLTMDRDAIFEALRGAFSGIQATNKWQTEAWAGRLMKMLDEGATDGKFDPFKEGRSQNYDDKNPKMMQKAIERYTEGKEEKKLAKKYVGKRNWAQIDGKPIEISSGKWEFSLSPYVAGHMGTSYMYVVKASDYDEALRLAQEMAQMPVWRFDIPPSARKNLKGPIHILEFAGMGVGAAAASAIHEKRGVPIQTPPPVGEEAPNATPR